MGKSKQELQTPQSIRVYNNTRRLISFAKITNSYQSHTSSSSAIVKTHTIIYFQIIRRTMHLFVRLSYDRILEEERGLMYGEI